jgi:hypothetical protein
MTSKPPNSHPIKPMPVTSMPDRCDPRDQRDYGDDLKRGVSTTGNNMNITGGRKP